MSATRRYGLSSNIKSNRIRCVCIDIRRDHDLRVMYTNLFYWKKGAFHTNGFSRTHVIVYDFDCRHATLDVADALYTPCRSKRICRIEILMGFRTDFVFHLSSSSADTLCSLSPPPQALPTGRLP